MMKFIYVQKLSTFCIFPKVSLLKCARHFCLWIQITLLLISPFFFLVHIPEKNLKNLKFIIIVSELICVSRNSYLIICKLILLLDKDTHHFPCTFLWCTRWKLDYDILTNLFFFSNKTEPFPKVKSYQLGKPNLEIHLETL